MAEFEKIGNGKLKPIASLSVNEWISARIAAERKSRGYTMVDMGRLFGITRYNYSNYENCVSPWRVDMLVVAADFLGLHIIELFHGYSMPKRERQKEEPTGSPIDVTNPKHFM